MAKCDVCGKMSLLPEKFGKSLVCKVCFVKVKGPLWKYRQYDRAQDVEKQRRKSIEAAMEYNFPERVIGDINGYFNEQAQGMSCCDGCGSSVQTLNTVGSAKLCKKCYSKIDKDEWKENIYLNNEEVENNRKKILVLANKQSFPQIVLKGIDEHFDSKIQKGLIDAISGSDQTLKVFETHCIIETYDDFDEDEMSKKYAKLLQKSTQGGGLISNSAVRAIVRGVLRGGIIGVGMSLATSAAKNAVADALVPDQAPFRVKNGKFKIDYEFYDLVDYQKMLSIGHETELGYMKFRSSQQPTDESNSILFFFEDDHSVRKIYNYICERIEEIKRNRELHVSKSQQVEYKSVADEILKFKNLLDLGAITEEEYFEKKKELLNS